MLRQTKQQRPCPSPSFRRTVALLAFVLCCVSPAQVEASTSSTLLKHAVKTSSGCTACTVVAAGSSAVKRAGASSVAQKVFQIRTATQTGVNHARSHVRPFLKRGPASSGFKSFSTRATRLQTQLQQSFSLKAIFSDVITNHPGRQVPACSERQRVIREDPHLLATASTKDLGGVMRVRPRPPLFQDIQRIAAGTLSESWSGFVGGYALATTADVTKRVFGMVFTSGSASASAAAATTGHILPYPGLLRHSQQSLQMHSRSMQFGTEWAQMSAVFGASRLLVQTLRRKEDEWNTVAGSALAGAIFASCKTNTAGKFQVQLPPAAITRGAILYSGTMFLLHPRLWKPAAKTLMLETPKDSVAGTGVPMWDGLQ